MDAIPYSTNTGGHSTVGWILLLCLTVNITGPRYVTVGVPVSFECAANCTSAPCKFTMHEGTQASPGNALAFTLHQWKESLTVTCSATDRHTGVSETATKILQVLAGPANVSISGPMPSPTASHIFSCHADCRPLCKYTWRIDDGPWVSDHGNVTDVIPQATNRTLVCKATNTVSGLFAATTRDIPATSGPSEVQIIGPDTMELATRTVFVCLADCLPSCRYTWTVGEHTLRGSKIDIMVDRPLKSVALKCEAQNTVIVKSSTVTKTIWIVDHSMATRPEKRLALLLCACVVSAAILI
ncbi:hypothetical protein NHX12_020379 [Muraenolepis orangiensis]|uniref:Ig-like domain-containing protein n=1 Tax=Muraenolepis orangiensis TaxID=630683 RepID=A0A9Q0ISY3_9TELE|nr:hypothetical protein NHX12_020379 [Muraenolepis orangiensis]